MVRGLAFSPDGKIVASCGEDHLVKLWDVATGLEVETLRGHPSFVHESGFRPRGPAARLGRPLRFGQGLGVPSGLSLCDSRQTVGPTGWRSTRTGSAW